MQTIRKKKEINEKPVISQAKAKADVWEFVGTSSTI